MAGYYFFFVAMGGQVDAGVLVLEYIDVRRYTLELSGGEDSRNKTQRTAGRGAGSASPLRLGGEN